MKAASALSSSSCPSSPLQQNKNRSLRTPPSSGRSTPLPPCPPLSLPPLALPRAAAALAALSLEAPTTAEARCEVVEIAVEAPAPLASNVVKKVDPIEAENDALAEFVSWLIAIGTIRRFCWRETEN